MSKKPQRTYTSSDIAAMDFSVLPQIQEFPAMQFYPKDWLTGRSTRAMSPSQRSGFIDLLAEAWDEQPPCSLPDDDEVLSNLSRLGPQWKKIGALVKAGFVKCADGRLRNPKQVAVWLGMLDIRQKRRGSRDKQGPFVTTNGPLLSSPAIADTDAAVVSFPVTQDQNNPSREAVRQILDACTDENRPTPSLAALWLSKLETPEAVIAVVGKYPTKPAAYVTACIETAAKERHAKRNERRSDGGTGKAPRATKPAERNKFGQRTAAEALAALGVSTLPKPSPGGSHGAV